MAKTIVVKPLGLVLRKAGLVSSVQIEKALKESLTLPQCKVGEVLAIRGCIKPETADFFAEVWPQIIVQNIKKKSKNKKLQPLGQYLKAASLINQQQIDLILEIQQKRPAKFGKLAVENKIISQTTLDFFLEHLNLIKTESEIKVYPEALALELDKIENYLLNNQKCEPIKILKRYQSILKKGKIISEEDRVEKELLNSGIIIKHSNFVKVAKSVYAKKFDADWLEKELARLQPYNQIRLEMFDLDDKASIPHKIINTVNYWTNREPFLTQKVYQLIKEKSAYIPSGQETAIVEELIYKYIVDDWQNGAAAKHFKSIHDRIFKHSSHSIQALLKTYKKIYQLKEIEADSSWTQTELLQTGLIKSNDNRVEVNNLIYQGVFNLQWIQENLEKEKSMFSEEKSISQETKTALLSKNPVLKTKHFFSALALILLSINSYFVIKMINSLVESDRSIKPSLIR